MGYRDKADDILELNIVTVDDPKNLPAPYSKGGVSLEYDFIVLNYQSLDDNGSEKPSGSGNIPNPNSFYISGYTAAQRHTDKRARSTGALNLYPAAVPHIKLMKENTALIVQAMFVPNGFGFVAAASITHRFGK